MPKKSISLKLQLIEENGTAHLVLVDGDRVVVDFENEEAPPVRVVGFNARGTNEDMLRAFAEREANTFGSQEKALDVLIHGQEKQLYNKLVLLRSEARKVAILGQSLRNAKRLRAELAAGRNMKSEFSVKPTPDGQIENPKATP